MANVNQLNRVAIVLLTSSVVALGAAGCTPHTGAAASAATQEAQPPEDTSAHGKPQPDLSGRRRIGIASFYAGWFAGREMADGTRMDPHGDNAASRTLPLGTIAKVTNLATGQSAVITIQDRGPYVKGRIVDLSPTTARKIGITRKIGIAKVRVAPIAVPLPDGRTKLGVAAQDEKPRPSRDSLTCRQCRSHRQESPFGAYR